VVDDKTIYKHAFWLYGVIIGLAIKQSFETVVPHWIHPTPEFSYPTHGLYLEVLRFFTFIFLTIRFYLGSAYYFGAAHESEDADTRFKKRSFATDFVLGFLHFLGFAFLALTISVHIGSVRLFALGIVFILVYDVFWLGFAYSFGLKTTVLIKWWAIVNGVVVLFSLVLYLIVERVTGSPMRAEIYALWVVFATTLIDIGWMMAKKPFFEPIRDLLFN
jgi:hypothetical protein